MRAGDVNSFRRSTEARFSPGDLAGMAIILAAAAVVPTLALAVLTIAGWW